LQIGKITLLKLIKLLKVRELINLKKVIEVKKLIILIIRRLRWKRKTEKQ